MLRNASAVNGYAIIASDGHLGTVSDFLFDDTTWLVRWLVVETGSWLSGRKVLLPAFALGHLDPARREFSVRLTRQQVKDSPDIDTERPVSRQMETGIYDYYGWSPYWVSGPYMGGWGYGYGYGGGAIAPLPSLGSSRREEDIAAGRRSHDDPHLRSTEAVAGYHIRAKDGEVGHVEDFLIEEADWSIHYLIVNTKNWWPGKKVLVSPRSVREIDWADNLVNLDLDRQNVKDGPAYNSSVTVDRAYEQDFHSYYDGIRGNLP
jgi:sporulation protein YlmC with PRC-barrel domain